MKIKVKDIKPEGIDIAYQIAAAEVGLGEDEYLYLIAPIAIKARVERVEDMVLIKGKASTRYHSVCSRTLVPVERDWSGEFMLDFTVEPATEFIEPDEDIRQEVILGLPVKVLSDEELKREAASAKAAADDELKEVSSSGKTYQPFADLKLKEK